MKYIARIKKDNLELWLYRNGTKSTKSVCGICGVCPRYVWSKDLNVCHMLAKSKGGPRILDNLVLGTSKCNNQQGIQNLCDYQTQNNIVAPPCCRPEDGCVAIKYVAAARKELITLNKSKTTRDPIARMNEAVQKLIRNDLSLQRNIPFPVQSE